LVFELVPGQTVIERFDPPGAGATVELTIATLAKNPNPFGVRLRRIAYDVAFDGRTVGRGELAPERFIAGGGQIPLRFTFATSLEGDFALMRAVARAFADTPLSFDVYGFVVFESQSHEVSTRRLPLVSGETMAREVVRPPRLRLNEQASTVFMLQADTPVVRVTVEAENPGSIGYFLYGRDLQLHLGGVPIAQQDMVPVPVPANQQATFELLFYPRLTVLSERGRSALEAALNGIPMSLEVRGALQLDVLGVDTFAVPEGWQLFGFVSSRRQQ
jgi:LEA14-like dessication related protein